LTDKVENRKVVIGEKAITIEQARKQYLFLTIANSPNAVKILSTLRRTDRPLTRTDIAENIEVTVEYTSKLLSDLIYGGFVAEFRMESRTKYYALTEKGFEFIKELKSNKKPTQ